MRNEQILIDEDTCWKFGGDKAPGRSEGLGERLSLEVKGERWDLMTGEGSNLMMVEENLQRSHVSDKKISDGYL